MLYWRSGGGPARPLNLGNALLGKALIVVAAQEDAPGIGRIRMRRMVDASAASLVPFVQDSARTGQRHPHRWLPEISALGEQRLQASRLRF